MGKTTKKPKGNIFLRNAILAVCILVIMLFLVQIFLGIVTRHGQVREVPDLSGMTMVQAYQVADKESLRIEINDSLYLPARTPGIVLEQNPVPGAKVKSGRRVFVTVNSFSPRKAVIPYVAGFSLRQAKTNLDIAGFEIEKLVYREDMATNNVIEQRFEGREVTPSGNIEAPVGSRVTLVVGISDDAAAKIPKVVGFPMREAKGRLWEVGFNVGNIAMDEGVDEVNINDARVYRQTPNAATRSRLGTSVDIFITLDESKVTDGSKESDRAAALIEIAAAKADSLITN